MDNSVFVEIIEYYYSKININDNKVFENVFLHYKKYITKIESYMTDDNALSSIKKMREYYSLDEDKAIDICALNLLIKYSIEHEKYGYSDFMNIAKHIAKITNVSMIYLCYKTIDELIPNAWYYDLEDIDNEHYKIILDNELNNKLNNCYECHRYKILYFSKEDKTIDDYFNTYIHFFIDMYIQNYNSTKYSYLRSYFEIQKEKIIILHISDCHITKDITSDEYAKSFLKKYGDNKKDIDFITITGDLINASKATSGILDNCITASEFVEKISKVILGNVWRERVIFVPGNHDYGLVSEFEAITDRRKLDSSRIVEKTEEYHKFVFYNFLFNEQLKGKLSNNIKSIVKDYEFNLKNKNINFLCFNTAKNSNPDISNKVTLEFEPKSVNIDDIYIALMHHSKLFSINYYADSLSIKDKEDLIFSTYLFGYNYDNLKLINDNYISKKLNEVIPKIKKNNDDIEKVFENPDEMKKFLMKYLDKPEITEDDIKRYDKLIKDCLKRIYSYNAELIDICEKYNDTIDEHAKAEYSKILNLFTSSIEDTEKYDNNFNQIKKNYPNIIVLSGHRHKYENNKEMRIVEAKRTFEFDDNLIKKIKKVNFNYIFIDSKDFGYDAEEVV